MRILPSMRIAKVIDGLLVLSMLHGRRWRTVYDGKAYVIGLSGHRIRRTDLPKIRRLVRCGASNFVLHGRLRRGFSSVILRGRTLEFRRS